MNKIFEMAFLLTLLLCSTFGCDYDDPDDPGAEDQVDFLRFSEPGRFREQFIDLVFQSGELAMDTLGGPIDYPGRLGPGIDHGWDRRRSGALS